MIPESIDTEGILEIFRKICLIRYFELNLKKIYDAGLMPKIPIYLSVGQETIAASLSMIYKGASLFGQHRGHGIYLAFGGDPTRLIDELLGLPTGCAGGMGGSASIQCPKIKMFGHDGLMGTQVPIGVGYAIGTGQTTITFMGDASAEEGYVLGAIGYAATKKAPILFVVCDNGLSILTKKDVRRNWNMADHAGFGIATMDITDDPWEIIRTGKLFKDQLPALINIQTNRELWHAGTGRDGQPNEFNRFNVTKNEIAMAGLGTEADTIEKEMEISIETLWNQRLQLAGRL